jgi:hypothetical protein
VVDEQIDEAHPWLHRGRVSVLDQTEAGKEAEMRLSPRSRAVAVVVATSLALGAAVAPVAAVPLPQPVTIVSPMAGEGFPFVPNDGTFGATGPAVGRGLICPSGAVLDTGYQFTWPRGQLQFKVDKQLTCDDGSGRIFVRLDIHALEGGGETFAWVVTGGTGRYARLHGGGQGSTEPADIGVINTYAGHLSY